MEKKQPNSKLNGIIKPDLNWPPPPKPKISNNVMKVFDNNKDTIMYRASCNCGMPEHDLTLELEKDEDYGSIDLNLYGNMGYFENLPDYTLKTRLGNLIKRFKVAIKLMFTGYIELEYNFMFERKEQVDDFIKAIQEGREILTKR